MSLVFSPRVRIREKVLACSFLKSDNSDICFILNLRLGVNKESLLSTFPYYFITVPIVFPVGKAYTCRRPQ